MYKYGDNTMHCSNKKSSFQVLKELTQNCFYIEFMSHNLPQECEYVYEKIKEKE